MALHFVSTSVLSSSDGIAYEKEEVKNTEETRLAKIAQQKESKPLYQQLAEQKELKDAEYEANSKLLRGPPKGLDEEDVAYFDQLANKRKNAADRRKEEEERELKAFKAAAKSAHYEVPQIAQHKTAPPQKSQPTISIKKKKRKLNTGEDAVLEKLAEAPVEKSSASSSNPLGSLLAGYDSDSS